MYQQVPAFHRYLENVTWKRKEKKREVSWCVASSLFNAPPQEESFGQSKGEKAKIFLMSHSIKLPECVAKDL